MRRFLAMAVGSILPGMRRRREKATPGGSAPGDSLLIGKGETVNGQGERPPTPRELTPYQGAERPLTGGAAAAHRPRSGRLHISSAAARARPGTFAFPSRRRPLRRPAG